MNLPNQLTLSRIILSPIFMVFLLANGIHFLYVAFGVFLVAAATDVCDGYFARRMGGATSFGKFMDPLADKLLISMALVGLLARGVPGLLGWMVVVIIARELIVTGFRSLAAYRGLVIGASRVARIKTVLQMSLVGWILGDLTVFRGVEFLHRPGVLGTFSAADLILAMLLWVTVFLTAVSGLDYLVRNREVLGGALK